MFFGVYWSPHRLFDPENPCPLTLHLYLSSACLLLSVILSVCARGGCVDQHLSSLSITQRQVIYFLMRIFSSCYPRMLAATHMKILVSDLFCMKHEALLHDNVDFKRLSITSTQAEKLCSPLSSKRHAQQERAHTTPGTWNLQ